MTPEQRDHLRGIADRVFDVLMVDADPNNWTGRGKRPNEMDAKERGDAVWCRKQAMSTLMLYERLTALVDPRPGQPPSDDADDEARLIAEAEAQAARLLDRMGLTRG